METLFPDLIMLYLSSFHQCFSSWSRPFFNGYVLGLLLCNTRKCINHVASVCWFVDRSLSSWERFLSEHHWSIESLTACWVKLLFSRLYPWGLKMPEIICGVDTTLITKVKGRMLGVQKWTAHPGDEGAEKKIMGHHWAIMGLIVRFGDRYLCFGLLSRLISGHLAPSHFIVSAEGECRFAHFWDTIHAMIWQILNLVDTSIYLICDAYFSKAGFLNPVLEHNAKKAQKVRVISRMRWDAVCFELETREYCGKGRPSEKGECTKISKMLKTQPLQTWNVFLYGKQRTIQGVSVIRKIRNVSEPVKLVVIDTQSSRPLILLSIDTSSSEAKIIELYGARFSIEILIREMKSEMGLCQYQCYTTIAFMRFVQLCLVITSLWKLFHIENYPDQQEISFAQLKTYIRKNTIKAAFSHNLPEQADLRKVEPLMDTICQIAA